MEVITLIKEPEGLVSSSEAERHLNFNPVPDNDVQKKIDYFITPYNKVKVVTKFMSFNDKEEKPQEEPDSHEKWKKISTMILNQNKHSLRNTLMNINDRLYKRVDQTLKSSVNRSPRNKRVKFATSRGSNPSRRGTSNVNVVQNVVRQVQALKRMSVPLSLSSSSGNQNKGPRRPDEPRDSLVSTIIEDIRENQRYDDERKMDKSPSAT